MSIGEANAQLTAPGQIFEMEVVDIRGVPTRIWKNAPPTLRSVFDMSAAHGDATFVVYEDERTTFAEHYRMRLDARPPAARHLRRRKRRPGRHRHAEHPRVDHRLLGRRRSPAPSSCRSTRGGAARSCATASRTRAPRSPSSTPNACERLRPFLGGLDDPPGRSIVADEHRTELKAPLDRLRAAGRHAADPRMALPARPRHRSPTMPRPRRHHRPRGRRHHLLHVGHDRAPEGCGRHPSQHDAPT